MLALLTQSFEIFNVYGKEPEAVKSILGGFSLVLAPYEIGHITAAFTKWMQLSSVMPTPSDILKLVKESVVDSNFKRTGKPKWIQEVRDLRTDELLESHDDGKHAAPIDLWKKYGARLIRCHMRRDPSLNQQGE